MPDDPALEDMDPIMRAWMFNQWVEDYNDEFKLLENQGYLIGSFTNPEAVRKILGVDGVQHTSTEAESLEALKNLDKFDDNAAVSKKESKRDRKKKKGTKRIISG
jgi:hypothetical protein